ncbi:unnamed protein product [Gordionus sp. m RMFG-2023]
MRLNKTLFYPPDKLISAYINNSTTRSLSTWWRIRYTPGLKGPGLYTMQITENARQHQNVSLDGMRVMS